MSWLDRSPFVVALRGVQPREVEAMGTVLESAGILNVEVPLNSPDPLRSISMLAKKFGDRMLVGAGTVTRPELVGEVASAGGRLIVTPHADTAVVRAAKAAGLLTLPGFSTATEAFALLHAGADAIKLFPSEVLGIPMLKALRAVLPAGTPVVPFGGIDVERVEPWMAAGARGLGIGSFLYKPGDTPDEVGQRAEALMDAYRSYRNAASHKTAGAA